jgi:pimeloyl-ACP methyl ester carboxylesterase
MREAALKAWFWALDYWQATVWQLQALRRPGKQLPRERGAKHVVVIPGVFEPLTFMAVLMRDARRAGYVVHGLSVLGYNTGEIPRAAKDVDAYIREHDLRNVTILAHSKGGLIGKYLQAMFDTDDRIDRMVAVATPFAGSVLAGLLPVRSVRDFLPTGGDHHPAPADLERQPPDRLHLRVVRPAHPQGQLPARRQEHSGAVDGALPHPQDTRRPPGRAGEPRMIRCR